VYTSDGGGIDGARLDIERGVAVQSATVATDADGLKHGVGDERGGERLKCARIHPKRDAGVLENTFGVLMTGCCTPGRRNGRRPEILSAAYRDTTEQHDQDPDQGAA
jgi:hypothetical protein